MHMTWKFIWHLLNNRQTVSLGNQCLSSARPREEALNFANKLGHLLLTFQVVFLGIFLGATLLAIGYTVLRSWLDPAPSVATD